MKVAHAVCAFLVVAACNAQDFGNLFNNFGCRSIERQDCFTWGNHPECGTNGVTYRNRCDYSKAHCADNSIHVAYQSACVSTTPMATTVGGSTGTGGTGTGTGTGTGGIQTGPVLTGPEAIFDFFCLELSHQPCHTDLETICGSDGNTYINTCEFEKQRCTHRELKVAKFEKC